MKTPLPPVRHLPSSSEKRERLNKLQHSLVITRAEELLRQAKAGEIAGLLVVVHSIEPAASKQTTQLLFVEGTYRADPKLAFDALQHGINELFMQMKNPVTDQLLLHL